VLASKTQSIAFGGCHQRRGLELIIAAFLRPTVTQCAAYCKTGTGQNSARRVMTSPKSSTEIMEDRFLLISWLLRIRNPTAVIKTFAELKHFPYIRPDILRRYRSTSFAFLPIAAMWFSTRLPVHALRVPWPKTWVGVGYAASSIQRILRVRPFAF